MSSYGQLAAWYASLTGDVPYREFADFYERVFTERGRRVRSVLDLACGTGAMTLLLAGRGYDVTGVDASPEMLAMAADKAAGQSIAPPLLLCQELSEMDLYGASDAAVCCLDGMNYLPPEELPEVFRRLRCFIEPGGLLIFDVNSPERLRSLDGGIFMDETDDMVCVWRADFDGDENALVYGMYMFSLVEGGLWRRSEEEHVEYAHEPGELLRLLERAGFLRAELRTDGPQSAEGRVFIVAENPGEFCERQ